MTLPTFIVAGTFKAATTSIYDYLKQHPQIFMPEIKEAKYFVYEPHNPEHVQARRQKYPVRTLDEYRELFGEATDATAIGEASPVYISSLFALQQIYQTIPDVQLIFSLRNPIDRAYSAYSMRLRNGYESRPVRQAMQEDAQDFLAKTYYKQLLPWYEHFPAEQIKVVLFEDIKQDAVQVMQEIYQFLGVDRTFVPDVSYHQNIGGVPKSQTRQTIVNYLRQFRLLRFYLPKGLRIYFSEFARDNLEKAPPLPTDIRQMLAELYSEDIAPLSELTGLDLSVWGMADRPTAASPREAELAL